VICQIPHLGFWRTNGRQWIGSSQAYMLPKEEVEGEHFVCKKDEIPVGGTRAFVIEGSTIPYILIHLESGDFKAYEQKCTHLSCSVFINLVQM